MKKKKKKRKTYKKPDSISVRYISDTLVEVDKRWFSHRSPAVISFLPVIRVVEGRPLCSNSLCLTSSGDRILLIRSTWSGLPVPRGINTRSITSNQTLITFSTLIATVWHVTCYCKSVFGFYRFKWSTNGSWHFLKQFTRKVTTQNREINAEFVSASCSRSLNLVPALHVNVQFQQEPLITAVEDLARFTVGQKPTRIYLKIYPLNNHPAINAADFCSPTLKKSNHKDQNCNLVNIFIWCFMFHEPSLFEHDVYQWQSQTHGFWQPGFHIQERNSINLKVGLNSQSQQHITEDGHWISLGTIWLLFHSWPTSRTSLKWC